MDCRSFGPSPSEEKDISVCQQGDTRAYSLQLLDLQARCYDRAMLRSLLDAVLAYWPGYPPDWERRRMRVFERAYGRCERCGWPAGAIRLVSDRWRVCGAHVHHVRPISQGGRHHLANLQLLCAACHADAHPGNERLRERSVRRGR